MKKIKGCNEKDRIICICSRRKIDFYYQLYKKNEQVWLFQMPFSRSVFEYYRNYGRYVSNGTYSITVAQMYQFKGFKNSKLTHVFERLPNVINYVLTYEFEEDKADYKYLEFTCKLDERIA